MSKAEQTLTALGGDANIIELEPRFTRLRIKVIGPALVDEAALKATDVFAVVRSGRVVRAVVGTEADTLASDIEDLR